MWLKKLIVKNFKSLRDCEVELSKFNVLIGANASGKTNLIEVFKLLRKIYVEKDTNPFLEWWGYNNVVWSGKEELPITIGMLFDVDGYEVYFETTFTGTGGSFRILKEILGVKGYLKLVKEGVSLRISYASEWLGTAVSKLPVTVETREFEMFSALKTVKEYILPDKYTNKSLFELCEASEGHYSKDKSISYQMCYLSGEDFRIKDAAIPVVCPNLSDSLPGILGVISEVTIYVSKLLLLEPLSLNQVKAPKIPRKETLLMEDASNLIPVLYNIWLREGKLPAEIAEPLSIAFPDTRVFFQLTEDGRVMMKVFEGELELAPPGISDGFYKTLAILTAVYLKPSLLIIDEVENSLHPETLELLLDTLRNSESQAIITTHSPVVVDMTDPADVIFVEKIHGETVFKRIPNPEEIKKMLQEKGLAFSEGWLYGEIFKE
ncbi:AAA family ATPase [Thermococcus sp. Bubb.Bath]|uniref:AAA family ATPase n=1 Tax=Thermococcus sp. Bubb.Bath TaxID=1638242 RepID=UPI00143C2ECB|nr:AAA family ATPase [Thermococcus sp. Bubb.Bath]NJF24489.1 recombinase RecF [Thermococcus sp. Bubb.Bath]